MAPACGSAILCVGVGGPMRCSWYFFMGLLEFGQEHRGPMIPYCPGDP
ncbi:unnamed protein product, partial [Staurois parvus]